MRTNEENMECERKEGLLRRFLTEEEGIGVVEVILLMVVMIAAVALFKTQIIGLITGILEKITTQGGNI